MSFFNGNIIRIKQAIVLLMLLVPARNADCQSGILDSTFTFRAGSVETGDALSLISRQTGYYFTYDSRLIDAGKKTDLSFSDTKLIVVLDSILQNDSLTYSVIDKYIIISRAEKVPKQRNDSTPSVEVKYVSGVVIDDETLEPLPYATVALMNNGKGTVTNYTGEFGLKITPDLIDDTLSISYLGYIGREIAVRQAFIKSLKILMKREYISIPEIIIRNQVPQEIISRARMAIARNYGNTPALMTGFYREGVLKKKELQSYSEAILQIYKSAYSGTFLGDQIKVIRSRKIDNTESNDTLAVRLKAGLSTCLELDGAKNLFDFLNSENIQDYTYRITDIVTYDNESAYVIEFEQRENIDLALYKGTIYVNTLDYGILDAEFELNPLQIHKMKDSFISNSTRGFDTWPVTVKYSITYRKMDKRYFLNHVRGDLVFSSKQKRRLFNTQFQVFFELAITNTELNNVARFEREELAPVHSIFEKTITNYDSQFWGNQDFLKPEDNLLQALKNMNVKLQEFTK